MLEAKTHAGGMALTAVTTAMGFIAPWPEVVAGYFFAVAGGFAGMAASPVTERLGVALTILVALVIGSFAGMAHPHFANGLPWFAFISTLPIQLVMGVSGLASRYIARRIAMGDFSLPWSKKGKDK